MMLPQQEPNLGIEYLTQTRALVTYSPCSSAGHLQQGSMMLGRGCGLPTGVANASNSRPSLIQHY